MKKATNLFCLLLVIIFCQGCNKSLKGSEYVRFVGNNANGLTRVSSIDGWEYTIQYKPYEYIFLQEHGDKKKEERLSELEGTASFSIKIKRSDNSISPLRYNLAAREDYDTRLNYFLNKASKDIVLLYDSKDTLYPVAYEFENNYNLIPEETMLVVFALPGKEKYPQADMQISFNDQMFKNGIIKAIIKKKDLTNIPNLID